MTEKTLDAMAAGGMYDLVGGGFHRYSVDQRWLVPHFEKMLYDNALLAVCYLHGYQTTRDERYRRVVEQTIGYMLRELSLEGGGLASSQDADTDGKEGISFTWTRTEADIPDQMLHTFEGGRFILRGELDEAKRAELFELREQRPKPPLDDKAIASWNGLALAALAECGRVLERADWVDAASRARRVPARAALDARRPAPPHLARRRREGHGVPRGLRERRERAARAARRDRRAALARARRTASRGSRSTSSTTRRTAASSRRRTTARRSSSARRASTTTRRRAATR